MTSNEEQPTLVSDAPPTPPPDAPVASSAPEPDMPRRVFRAEYHTGPNWKSIGIMAASGLLLSTSILTFMNRHDVSQATQTAQQVRTEFEKERNAQHKVNGFFLESTNKQSETLKDLDDQVANANQNIQKHGKQLNSLQSNVSKIAKELQVARAGPKVDGALFAPSVGEVPTAMTAPVSKEKPKATPPHSHAYIYGMRPGPYAVWDNTKHAWLISVMENGVMNSYTGQVISRTPDGNFLVHLDDQNQDVYIKPDGTWQR